MKINWQWFIGIAATILLSSLGAYIYIQTHYENFNWKGAMKIMVYVLLILGVLFAIIYFAIKHFTKKKPVYDSELPKEPVDTIIAEEIWKQAFIEYNNIPCRIEKGKYYPQREDALIFHNRKPYTNPKTGAEFWGFEVQVNDGDFRGMQLVYIPIDRGEEHIRRNLNKKMERGGFASIKPDFDTFPMDTPKSAQDRLDMMRIEALQSGSSKEEVDDVFGPAIARMKQQEPVIRDKKKTRIKSPEVTDGLPEELAQSQEEEDIDDVERDQQEYRARQAA